MICNVRYIMQMLCFKPSIREGFEGGEGERVCSIAIVGCETSVELGRADLGTCSQRTVVLQYITHMKQEERMRVNKVVDVRCISRQVYSTTC